MVSYKRTFTYHDFVVLLGLEFLMRVFGYEIRKNHLATAADWRKRPLHPDLVNYAGLDAFNTIGLFYKILQKVN